jgi:hypothetical protein
VDLLFVKGFDAGVRGGPGSYRPSARRKIAKK